mmetsp:Transcript_4097/g.14340  ORF Transcript_4097/g.14340 Transcript_4097/m.14340 type:complete len:204 (-) Transcript_4097:324-935(-)
MSSSARATRASLFSAAAVTFNRSIVARSFVSRRSSSCLFLAFAASSAEASDSIFACSDFRHFSSSWRKMSKSSCVRGRIRRSISFLRRRSSASSFSVAAFALALALSSLSTRFTSLSFLANHPRAYLCSTVVAATRIACHSSLSTYRPAETNASRFSLMSKSFLFICVAASFFVMIVRVRASVVCVSRVNFASFGHSLGLRIV